MEIEIYCIDDESVWFNLLLILTMNSLNVKDQGKSSNQLAFHLPIYTQYLSTLDKVMKTIKINVYQAYKLQVDCLEDSEPDSYQKNAMKEKANELVRLHEAKLEKNENSTIFRANPNSFPDKWSQRYFSDYFNVFE